MKEKNMNNVAEKLPSLPPLMLLSTLLPRCLVCFAAQNIWTGCRAVSLLRHYYVYFKWHVQLRKDIFVLRSHHFDGFYFVSARLTEYDRAGRREKKLWEGMEAALMCRWHPAECSVERTAGLVAMVKAQSANAGLTNS